MPEDLETRLKEVVREHAEKISDSMGGLDEEAFNGLLNAFTDAVNRVTTDKNFAGITFESFSDATEVQKLCAEVMGKINQLITNENQNDVVSFTRKQLQAILLAAFAAVELSKKIKPENPKKLSSKSRAVRPRAKTASKPTKRKSKPKAKTKSRSQQAKPGVSENATLQKIDYIFLNRIIVLSELNVTPASVQQFIADLRVQTDGDLVSLFSRIKRIENQDPPQQSKKDPNRIILEEYLKDKGLSY